MSRLHTLAEYLEMNPLAQGYAQYWEGEQPGSELKTLTNPYPPGSINHRNWDKGQQLACQDAQDSEE